MRFRLPTLIALVLVAGICMPKVIETWREQEPAMGLFITAAAGIALTVAYAAAELLQRERR